jgi:hypothetical protein
MAMIGATLSSVDHNGQIKKHYSGEEPASESAMSQKYNQYQAFNGGSVKFPSYSNTSAP